MRLDPAHVAAESHVLVPSKPRHALGVLVGVERALSSCKVRELRWRSEIVRTRQFVPRPGIRCVAIRHQHLREWTVCITARPEGAFVAVGWYLVAKPSWRGDLRRLLRLRSSTRERETVGSELGVRGRADLSLLNALSRHALQRAIDEVGNKANGHRAGMPNRGRSRDDR
jgi:hypothetical protein